MYCTGRSTRERRSEYDRPETIEETAELVTAAGGTGIAVAVDHLDARSGRGAGRSGSTPSTGRLDVLVNDIWGGELLFEWDTPVWEHDLDKGLRMLRLAIDTHLITSHFALPLLIRQPGGLVVEMTDGTRDVQRRELPGLARSTTWPRWRSTGSPSRRATSSRRTAAPRWRSPRAGCARR